MPEVYVAAGSNVDAFQNLRRAIASLAEHYPDLRQSQAYRNRAVGFEGDDFINLVVGFHTADSIDQLLARLHAAEALCGRERTAPRWAPRSMDLDILLYGDLVCERPGLVLPRPDLIKRAYMLGPMAQLAPDVVHPVLKQTFGTLWEQFDRTAHALTPVDL